MCDSGFNTAGTEGTADIHIIAGLDLQPSQFANDNSLIGLAGPDQSICTGLCQHLLIVSKSK